MPFRVEHTLKISLTLFLQKQVVAVQALTTKIVTVVLRILKAFRDLLFSSPLRIFNRNIHQNLPITSFPNRDGMVLDQDLLSLALTYVANPKLEGISKGFAKASLQSYRLMFEELEQEGSLSLLVKQACLDHPIERDRVAEEVFKKRLKQVYCTLVANAKKWPEHAEIFATIKPYGPLSSKSLGEIAKWITDRNLIHFFKGIAGHVPQNYRQLLSNLNSSLPVKEKACALRQWLCAHPYAFHNINLVLLTSFDEFKLTEIPTEISYLTNLKYLFIGNNAIQFLPDAIGQLTQLRTLSLWMNQLQRLPDAIGQLTQLQVLSLEENQLQRLPDAIRQLTQLQKLNISKNQLQRLPDAIGQLTQLQELNISENQFKELPDSMGQLIRLQKLNISSNQLQRVPDSIRQLTRV